MTVLAVVAFILAFVQQIRARGTDLVAWAVMALSVIPAIEFFRNL